MTEKKEMTGLAIGIASMKTGERALLHVDWELGYGKEGSFSFPNVPPMADLIYEVELIGFDEAKDVRSNLFNFILSYIILTSHITVTQRDSVLYITNILVKNLNFIVKVIRPVHMIVSVTTCIYFSGRERPEVT